MSQNLAPVLLHDLFYACHSSITASIGSRFLFSKVVTLVVLSFISSELFDPDPKHGCGIAWRHVVLGHRGTVLPDLAMGCLELLRCPSPSHRDRSLLPFSAVAFLGNAPR